MKKFSVLVVLLAIVCLFSAAMAEDVITIGVFEPQTGENGGGGLQEVLGVRYANQVYPTITLGGTEYKIELFEADNKSDKTEAVTAAEALINKGVSAIVGSYGSGVSIAAGPIFAEEEIPAVGASCTNPQVTSGMPYYFRVCFLDPFQGTVLANYASQNGAKTAAVITQLGDDYSSGLGSFFVTAFKKLQGDAAVVSEEQFQTNQSDFKAILTNIKAKNPDVIFAPSSIATAPLIIKQARELGLTCPIMGGDTWENGSIIENAGKDAEGIVLTTFFDSTSPATEEGKKFVEGFANYLATDATAKAANGGNETIAAVSALGYDAYLAIYKAMEAADSSDPNAIRDALGTVTFDGVTGPIAFNEEGDVVKSEAVVKTVKDGAFTFLQNVSIAQ